MRTNIFLVIAVGCIAFYGCDSEKEEDYSFSNCMVFDQKLYEMESLSYSSIFDSYGMILLETTPESVIGRIGNLRYLGDKILVYCRSRELVLLFSKDGSYLGNIGSRGSGPGEYLQVVDLDYHDQTDRIFLLDRKQNKVLVYKTNGEHIQDIKINSNAFIQSMAYIHENRFIMQAWASASKRAPLAMVVNFEGKVEKSFLDNTLIYDQARYPMNGIRCFNDSIRIVGQNQNIIYRYNNEVVDPFIKVEPIGGYDKNRLEEIFLNFKNRHHEKAGFANSMSEYQGMYRLQNYFETKSFIIFYYNFNGINVCAVFYDKIAGEFRNVFPENDLFSLEGRTDVFLDSSNDYIIQEYDVSKVVDLESLKSHLRQKYLQTSLSLDVEKRIGDLSSNDNPILILYKVK